MTKHVLFEAFWSKVVRFRYDTVPSQNSSIKQKHTWEMIIVENTNCSKQKRLKTTIFSMIFQKNKNMNSWILNRGSKIFVMKLGDQNTVFSCNCSVSYPQMKVFIFKKKSLYHFEVCFWRFLTFFFKKKWFWKKLCVFENLACLRWFSGNKMVLLKI